MAENVIESAVEEPEVSPVAAAEPWMPQSEEVAWLVSLEEVPMPFVMSAVGFLGMHVFLQIVFRAAFPGGTGDDKEIRLPNRWAKRTYPSPGTSILFIHLPSFRTSSLQLPSASSNSIVDGVLLTISHHDTNDMQWHPMAAPQGPDVGPRGRVGRLRDRMARGRP